MLGETPQKGMSVRTVRVRHLLIALPDAKVRHWIDKSEGHGCLAVWGRPRASFKTKTCKENNDIHQ
ncbi:hypothetical protein D9R08_10435 [Rhodophyticola porphyridii]|uniref:Uncharacterized protein n=1 Tax=Rhodophyticola porphyridii TaxID=1852017 RepID=A0A3L9YGE4_9RHOB|nr:hypothetical protein D9R08_10435 [Rhodophyticola porphyridii]